MSVPEKKTAAERYDDVTRRVKGRLATLPVLRGGGIDRSTIIAIEREECIAAIEAAVAEERARCAAWSRYLAKARFGAHDLAEIIAEAIERGDEP